MDNFSKIIYSMFLNHANDAKLRVTEIKNKVWVNMSFSNTTFVLCICATTLT